MADNQLNDATSFQQAEVPILCAKGCGFFGSSSTMNMCSKCYRDHHMAAENAASAKIAVEKSLSLPSTATPTLVVSGGSSSKTVAEETVEIVKEVEAEAKVKAKNRCGCCNKKVGVVGFQCRCGSTYCGTHRYPEEHKCTFDYVEAGKQAIAKANPVIKADKINRF
ncbi:zinc finger A20 and AN1 domain-containing stress-associated protein 1-like [Silene latifolia]|uniref:zinc finger A20 and AN1 domain-containing stress-associated protein 1-like n=1 Tax=Silene latifolia TaxID=37657 RepID=UPI003D774EC2